MKHTKLLSIAALSTISALIIGLSPVVAEHPLYTSYTGTPTIISDAKYTTDNTWFQQDIDASRAYEFLEQVDPDHEPGSGVIVAVIDSGVSVKSRNTSALSISSISAKDYIFHPDLAERIWINDDPIDGLDNDNNGYIDDLYGINLVDSDSDAGYSPSYTNQDNISYSNKVADTNTKNSVFHGTHVSGIIGMTADNQIGSAGIAYGSTIMPIKACNSSGSSYISTLINGIRYAIHNGAKVINISVGESADNLPSSNLQTKLSNIIQEANDLGCTVIAAAGNDGLPTTTTDSKNGFACFPAYDSGIIGVMSNTRDDQIAAYSNWDTTPTDSYGYNIIAPGGLGSSSLDSIRENIFSTSYYDNLKAHYAYMGGTSMASPVVTGAAAVILQRLQHYNLDTVSNLRDQLLYATTQSIKSQNGVYTYPHLNLFDSLTTGHLAPSPMFTTLGVNDDGGFGVTIVNQHTPAKNVKISFSFANPEEAADFVTINGSQLSVDTIGADGTYAYPCTSSFGVTNTFSLGEDETITLPLTFHLEATNGSNERDTITYQDNKQMRLVITPSGTSLVEEDFSQVPANPNHTPAPVPTPVPSPTPFPGKSDESTDVTTTATPVPSTSSIPVVTTPIDTSPTDNTPITGQPVSVIPADNNTTASTASIKKLTCKAQTNRYTKLNWKVSGGNGIAIIGIYRSTQKNRGYSKIATVLNKTSYVDKSMKTGTMYYYKLRFLGKYSKATPIFIPKKMKLKGIILNRRSIMQIHIKKQSKISGYALYSSKSAHGKFKRVKSYKKSTTTIAIKQQKKVIYYQIRAYRIVSGKRIYGKPSKTIRLKAR